MNEKADYVRSQYTAPVEQAASDQAQVGCEDCGAPYGRDGWCDVIVPSEVWNGLGASLLCFRCMTKRIEAQGLTDVPVIVASGPYADANEKWRLIGWDHGYKVAKQEQAAPREPSTLLSCDPEVMSGAIVIAGTRIPISMVKHYLDAGYSVERIMSDYPDLSRAQINTAALAANYQMGSGLNRCDDDGGLSDRALSVELVALYGAVQVCRNCGAQSHGKDYRCFNCRAPYAAPVEQAAAVERDARDAARYRWLKENRGGDRSQPWAMVFDDDLENHIDAAIAEQAKERT